MLHFAYRSIVERLPVALKAPLKRAALSVVGAPKPEPTPAASTSPPAPDGTNLFDFVTPATMAEIHGHLLNPAVILQMQFARMVIARDRAKALLSKVRRAEPTAPVIHNALEYNLAAAHTAPMLDRPMVCTNVISSIEWIGGKHRATRDILSIGPRSEIEIFGLWSAGFSRERVKGLDLFSYSPFIDVGDMHAMPYPDNSFDVVILCEVLPYSKDQQAAANEVLRVCRNRAVVVVATSYTDEKNDRSTFNGEGTHNKTTEQIISLFGDRVRSVYFRHEASPPDEMLVMAAFEISEKVVI